MPKDETANENVILELTPNIDLVNVVGRAFDTNGKEVAIPARIEFYPQFYSPSAAIKVATVIVKALKGEETEEISRTALQLSGGDGKLQALSNSRKKVLPKFLAPKTSKPPAKLPGDPPTDPSNPDDPEAAAETPAEETQNKRK